MKVGISENLLVYLDYLKPFEDIRKPLGFPMFSGGMDKQHRAVMG